MDGKARIKQSLKASDLGVPTDLPVPPRTDTDALVEAWGTHVDAPLLQLALVHRSYANEAGGIANNERLEFLGDSVLSIVVAQKLYEQYPDVAESDLSRMRAATVSQQPLATANISLKI